MSSRVREPDDTSGVAPLVWRQMHASGPARTRRGRRGAAAECPRAARAIAAAVRAAGARGARRRRARGRSRRTRNAQRAELQPVIDRLARSIDELAGLRARLRRRGRGGPGTAVARHRPAGAAARTGHRSGGAARPGPGRARKTAAARRSPASGSIPAHAALITACLRQNRASANVRGDRRSVARAGHGDLRDPARQPGCLGGIAAPGDRARPGRPPAEATHDEHLPRPLSRRAGPHHAAALDRPGHRGGRPADRIARPERRDRRFLRGPHGERAGASAPR